MHGTVWETLMNAPLQLKYISSMTIYTVSQSLVEKQVKDTELE